jgi:hypothetical protein
VAKAKGQREKAAPYPLIFHGDNDDAPLQEWLVNETLPRIGKGLLSGQWGTFKTFVALDLARAVMTRTPFAGRDVKRQGAVLFIAAEGQGEVRVRLEGVARAKVATLDDISDAKPVDAKRMPFVWVKSCPRLTGEDAAETLCAIVAEAGRELMARFNLPLALVVIDTLMVAAQFKDANDAAEAQRVMSVLDAAATEGEAFIIGVDHFGKDVSVGTRNSSAKEGAADAVLALLGERDIAGNVTNSRLAIRKVRGAPTGQEIPFTTREITVYENAGYDAIKTLVVEWSEPPPADAQPKVKPKRIPASLKQFTNALDFALANGAQRLRPFAAEGPEVLAAKRDAVRQEFLKTYPADNRKAKEKAFERAELKALAIELMASREIGPSSETFFWRLTDKQDADKW